MSGWGNMNYTSPVEIIVVDSTFYIYLHKFVHMVPNVAMLL